ncbi:MAG: class I mannose-6-phosphate isomerase [Bacteroidales bacterium]|nr:class I mannose-6-phosphate isomerase [Bacteroidales bacterium]
MEEERKLYPFKFIPIEDSFAWGEDKHQLADLGYRDTFVKSGWLGGVSISEVMDMYMDRVVGDNTFRYYGRQFPVSVKIVDARERTPLVVHPDDEVAAERYDSLGKAKLWYVLEATTASKIYLGFSEDTDASALYAACLAGDASSLLNEVKVRKGDHFVICPGTVHAAEGVKLLEISEASPLDFCLCAWGREVGEQFDPSLNVVDALDFIDYKRYKASAEALPKDQISEKLAVRREFTVSRMPLVNTVRIHSDEPTGFSVYSCIDGEVNVMVQEEEDKKSYQLKAGETMLVPADVLDFYLEPAKSGTVILETVLDPIIEEDEYIDPSAEPSLEGEEPQESSIGDRSWRIL